MLAALHAYSDSELFALMQSAEKHVRDAAFKELYERFSQRIYAYCLHVLGSEDEALDIFQESFIRFYNAAPGTSSQENPSGMLLKIARNLCLNFKRDRKETVEFEAEHDGISPCENYENQELLDLISGALKYLEFEYREAFVLRMMYEMSYQEISEITGSTIHAVRNRVFRAKEKIRIILSPYVVDLERF
ncbi:MAG: RNA polymerase sigma factor [Bacteroidota bacterium]